MQFAVSPRSRRWILWAAVIVLLIRHDSMAGPDRAGPELIDTPAKAAEAQKAWAAKLGKPVEWTNTAGMTFRLIPPGTFLMGIADDKTGTDAREHLVTISRPFYLGKTEVTRAQWEKVTGTVQSTFFPGPDRPINFVSYSEDVPAFLARLNVLEPKAGYRAPTEAEWEYAARGGETGNLPGGNEAGLGRVAWYRENAEGVAHPVASKGANGFGLHDMLGNVWEWCSDFYDPKYYEISPRVDPQGSERALYQYRVLRGGSMLMGGNACRFGNRAFIEEDHAAKHIGFRVMLPIDAGAVEQTGKTKPGE